MLTFRQISIVTYLLGNDDFVSGAQLSARFNLGKTTLQKEIRDIEHQLGDDCRIAAGPKGYKLEYLAASVRVHLYDQMEAYGSETAWGMRTLCFAVYLLFQKNYVSMQQLADAFYLSKTAVALEIPTVKRWVERYDALTLEISPQYGIRIVGEEKYKRVYCAKCGSLAAFRNAPFHAEIVQNYALYLSATQQILRTALPEGGYYLTGEGYREVSRFIAVSILRSKMGYVREEGAEVFEQTPFMKKLSTSISQETHYLLHPVELHDIVALVEESCTLVSPFSRDIDIEQQLSQMESRLKEITGLENVQFFPERKLVLQYLEEVTVRTRSKNVAVNYYNEDIIRRFPLETHLMYRLFPKYFGGHVTKETSFMALFLANGLQQRRDSLSILLISNQNQSIISQLRDALKRCTGIFGIEVTVLPTYLFENHPEMQAHYDLRLATDYETLLKYPDFSLIPCVLSQEDMSDLLVSVGNAAARKCTLQQQEVLKQYLCEKKLHNNGSEKLTEIIGCDYNDFQSYHSFGKKNLYIGCVAPGVSPQIVTYELDKPISFYYRKISEIVFARYPEGGAGMLSFFDAVSKLLRQT